MAGAVSGGGEPGSEEGPACWICLGQERRDSKLGSLRSPCACRGSVGHVHERCLQEWVQAQAEAAEVHGLPACPTCKERYRGDIVLLLAASSALRLQLDLPPSAESRLVTALQQRRMTREAAALLRRRMRWNVLVADETHPETLQGLCNVASAMCEVRQWDAAAVLLRRVVRSCERLLGGRHAWRAPWKWASEGGQRRPAAWHREMEGDELEMLQHERRCVHAIARDAAGSLVEVLQKLGRFDEAEQQLSRKKALDRGAWLRGAWLFGAGYLSMVDAQVPSWCMLAMILGYALKAVGVKSKELLACASVLWLACHCVLPFINLRGALPIGLRRHG